MGPRRVVGKPEVLVRSVLLDNFPIASDSDRIRRLGRELQINESPTPTFASLVRSKIKVMLAFVFQD